MNIKPILRTVLLSLPIALIAAETPSAPKDKAPHGGRLMDSAAGKVEFLVKSDKTAAVYLFDAKMNPLPPSDQVVSLILRGKDGAKTKMDLSKGPEAFVSATPIEIPAEARAILTVKDGGKPENIRFDLNMAFCKGCQKSEYACACESHGKSPGWNRH